MKWNSASLVLNNISFFLAIILLVGYPAWYLYFMKKNKNQLSDEDVLEKFGKAYNIIDVRKNR
jgi:hypothetical protein